MSYTSNLFLTQKYDKCSLVEEQNKKKTVECAVAAAREHLESHTCRCMAGRGTFAVSAHDEEARVKLC